jgi:hypothetical protein
MWKGPFRWEMHVPPLISEATRLSMLLEDAYSIVETSFEIDPDVSGFDV